MRVLIAGATGTLGRPLARRLMADGAEIHGLTRRAERAADLEALGVSPIVVDALDRPGLAAAVEKVSPEMVFHLLTALPKAGPMRAADLKATNRLRIEGTRNLIEAATAAGVRRLVAESMVLVYGFGDHGESPLAEDALDLESPDSSADASLESAASLARDQPPFLAPVVGALRSLELQLRQARAAGALETVALRYGLLYGPDVPSTQALVPMLRYRVAAAPRFPGARHSFIHLEDAVEATLLAARHPNPAPVYNVTDDQPISMTDFMCENAAALGAAPPWPFPADLFRRLMPFAAAFFGCSLPISNSRARSDLGWELRYPTVQDGLRQTAEAIARNP